MPRPIQNLDLTSSDNVFCLLTMAVHNKHPRSTTANGLKAVTTDEWSKTLQTTVETLVKSMLNGRSAVIKAKDICKYR